MTKYFSCSFSAPLDISSTENVNVLFRTMTGWELSLGLYPGLLVGIRSYPEKTFTEHVLYLPLVEFVLTVYYE